MNQPQRGGGIKSWRQEEGLFLLYQAISLFSKVKKGFSSDLQHLSLSQAHVVRQNLTNYPAVEDLPFQRR